MLHFNIVLDDRQNSINYLRSRRAHALAASERRDARRRLRRIDAQACGFASVDRDVHDLERRWCLVVGRQGRSAG